MIENTNAEQSQVATDEIEIKVTEDNYDDQGNAPENNQPQDELETYTKGVSRRINKLNQRHRAAEERAAQLEQIAHQKEQELQQYKQYTAQMGGTMLQKEAENLNSKELQVDEIYKKAVESNDAELMSKATTLKNELAIQKEKLNVASQNQQAESQQQAQWQQQQQQQSQQQSQEYAEGGEVDEEPTDEAVTWHEKNSWYGDKSDPQNVEATQFAYYTHFNLLNEGFDADSDEYYSALDSRVERAYPHVKSVESTSSGSSADENRQRPAVQKVASTQHMGRQQTRGIKKSDVHFSQSELERLRGLKPHNMSEQDWLQRVAKEKQKKLSQGVR
tara:strand:+ start:6729 stop:7724 length:996 start_codon:yes stop_codon:yes gene_type:complete